MQDKATNLTGWQRGFAWRVMGAKLSAWCAWSGQNDHVRWSPVRSVNTGFYGQYLFFQHQISEHPFVQSINFWRALHWKQIILELIHSMGWNIAKLTSAFAPHLRAWWLIFFPMMCDGLKKQSRWCMIK